MRNDGLKLAKVIAVHPEGYAADLLFLNDGSRVPSVQVLAGTASTNSGVNDMPEPAVSDASAPYSAQATKDRDIYAVVGYVGGVPIVMGFLYPQVCQMLFADMNRRIVRHASDVYETTDAAGNHEFYHPSGTYWRIGTSPAHEDLTGKDFDKKWKIAKNTAQPVHAHFELRNNGVTKLSFDVDPSGNVVGSNVGNLNWTTSGNAEVDVTGTAKLIAQGAVTVKSAVKVTIDAPASEVTGTLTVDGLLTYKAGMIGSGDNGSGNAGSITGTLRTTSGDILADGISLKTHVHSGVQTGGGNTGAPV